MKLKQLEVFVAVADHKSFSRAAEALYLRLTEVPPFVVLCFKNGSVLTQWRQISGLTPTQQNIFYEFAQWNIA